MTTDDGVIARRKTQVIAAVFGLNLVIGASLLALYPDLVDQAKAPAALQAMQGGPLSLFHQIAMVVLSFAWLGLDSHQLGIRRPWWLNVGIALMGIVFVPYYLYKTRVANHRGGAILAYFGIVFASLFMMIIGMLLASMFGVAPSATPATS